LGVCDCEDCAKEIQLFAFLISKMSEDSDLWPFIRLVKSYEYPMLTAVATTPSLQRPDASDNGSRPDDYICHVFTAAMPRSEVRRLRGLDGPVTDRAQQVLRDIGVLTLEGTNFTTALQRELPAYYPDAEAREIADLKWREATLREMWMSDSAVAPLTQLNYFLPAMPTLQRPRTLGAQSRFYRWVVSAWLVTEDALDFAIVDDATGRGDGVYAQTMQDFIEMRRHSVRWLPTYKVDPADLVAMDRVLEAQPPLRGLPAAAPPPPRDPAWMSLMQIAEPHSVAIRQLDRPLAPPFIGFRLQHVKELTGPRLAALEEMKKQGYRVTADWYGIADDINLMGIYVWPPDNVRVDQRILQAVRTAMP